MQPTVAIRPSKDMTKLLHSEHHCRDFVNRKTSKHQQPRNFYAIAIKVDLHLLSCRDEKLPLVTMGGILWMC